MTTFRAIATDLDGTLVRSDRSISARTRAAVLAAEDAGLVVVIATGRPPRWIAPVVEALGERGLVVCANGASVYDPARHELVDRTELAADVAGSIIDDVSDAFPDAVIGLEQGFDFSVDDRFRELADGLATRVEDLRIGPVRSFLDRPVTKLIVRLPHPAAPGTAEAVRSVVGDRANVTHSTQESFLELSHPSAHKAATVERLLLERGIDPAEVVAFGDMPNDLELIRWAGLGVAVANAHPLLREAADEVTASNDDDGVALVIERLLGLGGVILATGLALGAAVLHATWNLLLKTAPDADRDLTSWGLYLVGGVLVIPVVVGLGGPGLASVPWLALSGLVHVAYIVGLVSAYQHGDFSLAYPLARGGGALAAAVGGALLLGDELPWPAWVAIAVVAGALISLMGRGVSLWSVRGALLTAAAIGTYTLVDAHGSRVSADSLAYGLSTTSTAAVGVSLVFLARRRHRALVAAWPHHWPRWVAAGACLATAYTMVVVAVRYAPVGYVAMLRESSVVLGAFLGWRFLHESLGGRRLVSSLVILAGMLGLIAATV